MDYHFIRVNIRNGLEIFIVVSNEIRKDDKEGARNTLEKSVNQNVSKRTWMEQITSKYLAWIGGRYQSGF
jgi:hypothetical protein